MLRDRWLFYHFISNSGSWNNCYIYLIRRSVAGVESLCIFTSCAAYLYSFWALLYFTKCSWIILFFFVFNALLTQKIVTTVYKNRKVIREKKEKRIKPTHTARQYNSLKRHKAAKKLRYKSVKEVDYTC